MSELKQRDLPNWDVSRINAWPSIICTLYQGFLNFLFNHTLVSQASYGPVYTFTWIRFQKDSNRAYAFMGHFLCGVEIVKRYLNVQYALQRQQPEKDKQNVDVLLGKISADAHGVECFTPLF